MLQDGPASVKDLQTLSQYKSRSIFLKEVLNPIIEADLIYRDGNFKSPTALIRLKKKQKNWLIISSIIIIMNVFSESLVGVLQVK